MILEKINIVRSFIKYRNFKVNYSREKLEAYQNVKESRIKKYAKQHSQYYAVQKESHVIDKDEMMNNFDLLNTVGINKDQALELAINSEKTRDFQEKLNNITVGLSSGTSGHRGLFLISDKEKSKWAGAILAKALPKNNIFHHKIAFFLRADSNLYETINSKFITFEYFDIYKNMETNIERLNEYQPTILVAPPSVLTDIADAIEENKISISPIKIFSVAEVLEKTDENRFKIIFKQDIIHQIYQCTEGFLGITCECGTMHLNEDLVKIEKEYIDDKRFIPIITDLERTTQPIINYRLNDILVEKQGQCKCGRKTLAIECIEGRTDDIFIFADREQQDIKVFADFIRRCIIFVKGIKNYKVKQLSRSEILILIDVDDEIINNQIIKEFEILAVNFKFLMPKINFGKYENNYDKKLKRIERCF